jgi:DNA-binding beta-propeller fold protein YncE
MRNPARIRKLAFLIALGCVGIVIALACLPKMTSAFADDVVAPEFPQNLQWLNVDKPLTMQELHGKVVVLDFWCFCCINCMHAIPDLKKLEAKYGDALAVIGVHSAKYIAEKDGDNIRNAILRYELTHPVINDRDFAVWNSFGVSSWPTFVLIDPDGSIVDAHSGEGVYDAFDAKIADLIQKFDAQGKINRTPLALHLERDKAPPTPLLFPGKIAADADGSHLIVSDSGHNRIVELNAADGSVSQIIGQGTKGLRDGSFEQAQFFRPQGLAVDGQVVYVADTENHAIRKIDLAAGKVTTLAGTGKQAQFDAPGIGTQIDLSSPWDVLVHDGVLYIAMAGVHQLWTLNLQTGEAAPFAGTGAEGILGGALPEANFAQTSGLATDGKQLFTADSETSSIRAVDFDPRGQVRTLVGSGLFVFGDKDGERDAVLLQHPLGVLFYDGAVYVADTYNNKIKKLDPNTGRTETVVGNGQAGFEDGPALSAELNEPGGLTAAGGKIFIADTNNHLIRIYDPQTKIVSTLQIAGVEKLLGAEQMPRPEKFDGKLLSLAPQEISASAKVVELSIAVPDGYALNPAAPFYIALYSDDAKVAAVSGEGTPRNIANPAFPMNIPIRFSPGSTRLTMDLVVYYCSERREAVCLVRRLRVVAPINVTPRGTGEAAKIHVVLEKPAE